MAQALNVAESAHKTHSAACEEGTQLALDFGKLRAIAQQGLDVIPAVAQDARTGDVLIIGYANEEALKEALQRKVAVFWSTSRNELWVKGASSGDYLELEEVRVNCEQNSILYRVVPQGMGACHTKASDGRPRATCFYRRIENDGKTLRFVCGHR